MGYVYTFTIQNFSSAKTYDEAMADAVDYAKRLFDEGLMDLPRIIVGEPEEGFMDSPGVYCPGCEDHITPGIRWPAVIDGNDDHEWVERCDTCGQYEDDEAAAKQLADEYEGAAKVVLGKTQVGESDTVRWFVDVDR